MTKFVKYPVPLSGNSKRLASPELPIDLTLAEAEHLAAVIRSITMPDQENDQ